MASVHGTDDIIETTKEAVSLLSERMSKTFENCNESVDLDTITEQLEEIREMKVQARDKFEEALTREVFLRSVSSPPSEWAALTSAADEELQKAKNSLREAKQMSEDQKTKMFQLNEIVVQGSSFYQEQIENLKDKLKTLENLVEDIHAAQKTLSDSGAGDGLIARELEEQNSQLEELVHESRKELFRAELHRTQLEMEVSDLRSSLRHLHMTLYEDQENMDSFCLNRMVKSIKDTEILRDITCHMVNSKKVIMEFPPRTSYLSAASNSTGGRGLTSTEVSDKDLTLKVTLSLREDGVGYLRLVNVQSNITSFGLEDLWEEYSESDIDNLSQLVSRIKARWFSHIPLLSEINNLQHRFAIDWIQKENILRVIVGKGGGIVCSLNIPPSYPHQGQVTLDGVIGSSDSEQAQILEPETGSRLEDWVQHLENTFGKP